MSFQYSLLKKNISTALFEAKYEESGLKEKRVNGIKVLRLDEKYLLANVSWIMKFGKDEQEQEFDDIKATYILKNEEDDYKIILQLDHQKLSDFF